MGQIVTLDAAVMTAREAARQLRIPAATLAHWLEGGVRGERRYEPILRSEPTGSNTITWGEMVEAKYLRSYRRDLTASMQRLAPFVAALRQFGCPSASPTFAVHRQNVTSLSLQESATSRPLDRV
jgi:hypothetical protein